jgi:thioredoxin 1
MKTCVLVFLAVFSMSCSATELNELPPGVLLGKIGSAKLLADYPSFMASYEQYQPSHQDVEVIKLLQGKSIVVLFGTWCHDSQREVPRLLKLLDLSEVELENLSLHGVNYNKQEPSGLHKQFNLKYTSTIILLEDEQEIGRIIEKPVQGLSQHLVSFIRK